MACKTINLRGCLLVQETDTGSCGVQVARVTTTLKLGTRVDREGYE